MRLIILLLCVSACEPMVTHRGHIQQNEMLESLQAGITKAQVRQTYGSPSSISSFGEETWYYVQARKEAQAFFRPEITEQQVVGVVFGPGGAVSEVRNYSLDDRQELVLVDKVTPTEGHSIGFLEQVLGNVGRFNAGRDRQVTPGSGPGRL